MNKIQLKGIMPALVTPFDENEKLIKPTVKKLLDFEYARGAHGFYVGGATGEGPVLNKNTRMELCETVMEENKNRGKIILHVGGPNFSDVKELVNHANKTNVDAFSSMAPNAYYGHSDKELVHYYKSIASLTDKPLMVYVTPLMLGNNIEKVFTELLEVDNIIGLKFTLPNYYLLGEIKKINGGNINVINGPDEMLICGLTMGADGGIGSTYNLMPERYVALYDAFNRGDIAKAREIQYGINSIIKVLLTYGNNMNIVQNLKSAFGIMGFDMGVCQYPTLPYNKEETEGLKVALEKAGYVFEA